MQPGPVEEVSAQGRGLKLDDIKILSKPFCGSMIAKKQFQAVQCFSELPETCFPGQEASVCSTTSLTAGQCQTDITATTKRNQNDVKIRSNVLLQLKNTLLPAGP